MNQISSRLSDREGIPTLDQLYYGDCLSIMREWPSKFVDLIYLDPPFNSKKDYNVFAKESKMGGGGGNVPKINGPVAQLVAFSDTWHWTPKAQQRYDALSNPLILNRTPVEQRVSETIRGLGTIIPETGMLAYLTYMAQRLVECRRVLKKSGSIYLHCDPTASHYLKVLMDGVFGGRNFRNEIIWRIGWVSGFKTQKRGWIRNHDTILYYIMSNTAVKMFNKEYIPYAKGYRRRDGKKPAGKGIPIEDTWNCHAGDVLDSEMIKSFSREKTGYATQKPLKLLNRIIRASSNEGDIILDPFCGCGTTAIEAKSLGRRFIGIDISAFTVKLVQKRMRDVFNGYECPASGIPLDMPAARMLAESNPFEFEKWAVMLVPGLYPNDKQRGDGGIDGYGNRVKDPRDKRQQLVIAQVKGGKHRPTRDQVDSFCRKIDRFACIGIFITLEKKPTERIRAAASTLGTFQVGSSVYPRIQFWSIKDHFEKRPPNLPPMIDPGTGKQYASRNYEIFEP